MFLKSIPSIKAVDLLVDTDLSREEVYFLFEFAAYLKGMQKSGKKHHYLPGKTLGMIFEKSSTRTRVSFEAGMYQLGGSGLFLSSADIQLGRGEPLSDTARVLSGYLDCIMVRTFGQEKVETLAEYASIPVINGLTDSYHPCQALTDYFTMYEDDKNIAGKKLCFIGDGNNVANSLLLTGANLGVNVAVACPKNYYPDPKVVKTAEKLASENGSTVLVTSDIEEAAEKSDYLYTDVWASMGQEKDAAKRKKAFAKYKISMKLIDKCAPKASVMHCLPAHRGEEIDEDVIESQKSIVFREAENRMHLQKALICALMNK